MSSASNPVAYTSTAQLAALDNGYQRSITAICPRYAVLRDDMVPLYLAQPAAVPVIRYDGLYEYAEKHRLDYNELCRVVRVAIEAALDVRDE